jgi:predicted nucleic-acid-binding protein
MTSLDTNVVVRLIVGDDARQAQAAERLVASRPCQVATTVLLETEWVLRAAYDLPARTIAMALRNLLAIENIDAADPALADRALTAYESGLDFADALHASQRVEGDEFATFDRALIRGAVKCGLRGIVMVNV